MAKKAPGPTANINPKKRRKHSDKKVAAGNTGGAKRAQTPAAVAAAKAQTNVLLSLATFSNPNPKHLGPFSDRQHILVVGDGDLSFSLALAVFLGGKHVVATCYDSQQELRDKYPNALVNADALKTAGSRVFFNVDATALEKQSWMAKEPPFHSIVFNFPHLGGATEEDVAKNQELLRFFFFSARRFLHPTQGQVLVALRNTLFYNRWKIQEQAKASGLQLKRMEPFNASIYSGYEAQRTHPASFRGEPPSTTGAHYYIFSVDKTAKPEDPRRSTLAISQKPSRPEKKAKTSDAKPAAAAPSPTMSCKICSLTFRDAKKFNGHMNSAKHAKKAKAMKKR